MLMKLVATSLVINGSEESGIDVLRNKIKNFASTVSLEGGRKYVILDEADYLNPQSTQPDPFVGSWKNFTKTVDSFLLVIIKTD